MTAIPAARTTTIQFAGDKGERAKKYATVGTAITIANAEIAATPQANNHQSPRETTTAFPIPAKISVVSNRVRDISMS